MWGCSSQGTKESFPHGVTRCNRRSSCGFLFAMKTEKLTYERANELLRYEPESGKLFWRVSCGRVKSGDEAGTIWKGQRHRSMYRQIRIDQCFYLAHRVAWLLHYGKWPKFDVDHIDGDGLNNRINNIRDVSRSFNERNQRMRIDNTSGVTGVYWDKHAQKWRAYASINRKQTHLGLFTNLADAETAAREFRSKHGFTERHGTDRGYVCGDGRLITHK